MQAYYPVSQGSNTGDRRKGLLSAALSSGMSELMSEAQDSD
ncbi:hypothetical protein ACFLV0_07615 [Chloroflexota bacterium]